MKLENRVALVTGADGPIGTAIALRFAREGAWVVLNDVVSRNLERIASEVVQIEGGKALIALGDVTNRAHVDRIVREALEAFGRLDVLVNNAGETQAVAAEATAVCAAAIMPVMRDQRAGRVIVTCPARRGDDDIAADDRGIAALVRRLALEYADCGITVNAVAPGATMGTVASEAHAATIDVIPMGRLPEPREVAAVYTFLASDDAAYMTGQVLYVDGGLSLVEP